jgi:RNA polymerase sigma factor (sigma-70 family)
MAAQRSGENALAAVKAAFADLLSQVTRHKEQLRGHWSRKPNWDAGAHEPAVRTPAPRTTPGPAHTAAEGVLTAWINANLRRLREFVDNELQLRIGAGQIREDQISLEEVIDEVMVSALSEENGEVALLSPEGWFHRLALRAIRRLIKANADTGTLSLDAPAGTQNVTGSDEKFLQFHQPDDSLPEESVIRDTNVRTPEEIFASEEMVAQLDLALHEVSAPDREAFVLYTGEGFTVEEISRLTGRSSERVRKSIQHAREKIRKKVPEQNRFQRSLLHRSLFHRSRVA